MIHVDLMQHSWRLHTKWRQSGLPNGSPVAAGISTATLCDDAELTACEFYCVLRKLGRWLIMIASATTLKGVIRQRHKPTQRLKGGVDSKLPSLATQVISAQISGKRCAYTCASLALAVAGR